MPIEVKPSYLDKDDITVVDKYWRLYSFAFPPSPLTAGAWTSLVVQHTESWSLKQGVCKEFSAVKIKKLTHLHVDVKRMSLWHKFAVGNREQMAFLELVARWG